MRRSRRGGRGRPTKCASKREGTPGSSRNPEGARPEAMRWATLCVSVFVLPIPAPAMIKSGSVPAVAASRCRSLSLPRLGASIPILRESYRELSSARRKSEPDSGPWKKGGQAPAVLDSDAH